MAKSPRSRWDKRLNQHDPSQADIMEKLGVQPVRHDFRDVLDGDLGAIDSAPPTKPNLQPYVHQPALDGKTIAYPDVDPRTAGMFDPLLENAQKKVSGVIDAHDTLVDVAPSVPGPDINPFVVAIPKDVSMAAIAGTSLDTMRLYPKVLQAIVNKCESGLRGHLEMINAQGRKDGETIPAIDFHQEVTRILPQLDGLLSIVLISDNSNERNQTIDLFVSTMYELVSYLLNIEYWFARNQRPVRDKGWPTWVSLPVRRNLLQIRKDELFVRLSLLEKEQGKAFQYWCDQFLKQTLGQLKLGMISLEENFNGQWKDCEDHKDLHQTNLPVSPGTIAAFIATILGAKQQAYGPGEKGISDADLEKAGKYCTRIMTR